MATITKERCRVAYTISGNSPEIRLGVEGASQTYKAGAVLFVSASGRLRALPTSGLLSRPDVGQGIAGLALKDAANASNSTTEVPFIVANDDTVFLANVASRFSTATASIQINHVGSVAMASPNGSRFYVSIRMKAATNSLVMVRGLYEQDTVGDLYGRVYFQFLRAARAFR